LGFIRDENHTAILWVMTSCRQTLYPADRNNNLFRNVVSH